MKNKSSTLLASLAAFALISPSIASAARVRPPASRTDNSPVTTLSSIQGITGPTTGQIVVNTGVVNTPAPVINVVANTAPAISLP
jgi:hypothetical protein